MPDCECLSGCPFFNGTMAAALPATVESMRKRYCFEDKTHCARHMIFRTAGKDKVPADMIPNQTSRARTLLEYLTGSAEPASLNA
jgi:hypothetical protein